MSRFAWNRAWNIWNQYTFVIWPTPGVVCTEKHWRRLASRQWTPWPVRRWMNAFHCDNDGALERNSTKSGVQGRTQDVFEEELTSGDENAGMENNWGLNKHNRTGRKSAMTRPLFVRSCRFFSTALLFVIFPSCVNAEALYNQLLTIKTVKVRVTRSMIISSINNSCLTVGDYIRWSKSLWILLQQHR